MSLFNLFRKLRWAPSLKGYQVQSLPLAPACISAHTRVWVPWDRDTTTQFSALPHHLQTSLSLLWLYALIPNPSHWLEVPLFSKISIWFLYRFLFTFHLKREYFPDNIAKCYSPMLFTPNIPQTFSINLHFYFFHIISFFIFSPWYGKISLNTGMEYISKSGIKLSKHTHIKTRIFYCYCYHYITRIT